MRIETAPELYAHAIAIERQAAARYADLATRMADEGRDDLARTFDLLAGEEASHLQALLARTRGVALPHIAEDRYQWLSDEGPETVARQFFFSLMTPRDALHVAHAAELRAQAFFERVFMTCDDPALRALAREMAAEEQEHVRLIERLLERTPDPNLASTVIFSR